MDKLVSCAKSCFSVLVTLGLLAVLYLAATNAKGVEVAVAEGSLVARPTASTIVAYNLSLVVSVRNRNSMLAWRAAPLDAELIRLGGLQQPLAHVRLAAGAGLERIRPRRSKVHRVAVAFATESSADVRVVELVVYGKFKYVMKFGSFDTTVRCPLRLPMSGAPQRCTDIC